MNWGERIRLWKQGVGITLPVRRNSQQQFYWQTNAFRTESDTYRNTFTETNTLNQPMDLDTYGEHFRSNRGNQHAVAFPNLSQDVILVCPMPRRGKNFAYLHDFLANGSDTQQAEFWRFLGRIVLLHNEHFGTTYVCTHGNGVAYLHVRVSARPYQLRLSRQ
jgi:hypothetical protein